jgi:NADPH:quinone reductase-like Zn-dependent oxidoreductase
MRAAVTEGYGPPEVVRIAERPEPLAGPGQIKVRVAAAGVSRGDARLRGMDVPRGFGPILKLLLGVRRPRRPVMGMEFLGLVEALGTGAAGFAAGDRVMGLMGLNGGAHAEALVIAADGLLVRAPESLTDDEAAGFFFGGLTAADFLIDKGGLQAGERVLVNGATGAAGSAAVQIARHFGARVTAVCRAENAALARNLGAQDVLDYRAGPIVGTWEVVMDVAGTLPWPVARGLLAPGGRLLPVTTGSLWATIGAGLRPKRDGKRITGGNFTETRVAMERLLAIHAAGGYRPVIGAALPFEQIVAAHRLAGSGHKRGNVVVVMGPQTPA